ncbi:MAG: DUF4867 domain-containing protein [Spirochaetae bacterium HGW-Spirochaetae-3]|jgi:hypothetical protein|nr:MAG: DUF4867 domain-containing protein [Spirochaetae bacterium HGW-Spirochaetae-3]
MDAHSLAEKNPGMTVVAVDDHRIDPYCRTLAVPGISGLVQFADGLIPDNLDANLYIASSPELESQEACGAFSAFFGYADIQVGYNAGPNSTLNGLEWHRTPEVLVAVSDIALLVGRVEDIETDSAGETRYDSSRVVCILVPRGTVLELRQGTLHLAPCRLRDAGFKTIVVLPRGTNAPLSATEIAAAREASSSGNIEAGFLFMRNKWIIAHPERAVLVDKGARPCIRGKNTRIAY